MSCVGRFCAWQGAAATTQQRCVPQGKRTATHCDSNRMRKKDPKNTEAKGVDHEERNTPTQHGYKTHKRKKRRRSSETKSNTTTEGDSTTNIKTKSQNKTKQAAHWSTTIKKKREKKKRHTKHAQQKNNRIKTASCYNSATDLVLSQVTPNQRQ